MKHGQNFPGGNKFLAWLTAGAVACQLLNFSTTVSAVTLTDGNSSTVIDLNSPAGMTSWTVDGVNIMKQQSFFYRTNPGGVGSSISPLAITQLIPSSVSATFAGTGFNVTTVYNLVGGAAGSGTSDIAEQIKIQNTTASPLVFNFFQFANFAGNGIVELGQNSRGFFNEAFISGGGLVVTENLDTGISPGANDGAVGDPNTILGQITGTPGYTPAGPDSGPGAWVLEWQRTIGANGSLIISKDLNAAGVTVAPEPPAWSLVSIGLIAFGAIKQYRSRRSK